MKKSILKILYFSLLFIFVPIYVHADDDLDEFLSFNDFSEFIEASSNIYEAPNINARHAVVFDRNSKQPVFCKKEKETCKMASTTKIMTAIVVLEKANLSDVVTISAKAAGTGGSRVKLPKNAKVSVEDLLYGLMMKSGNDAAVALAEYVGGSVENFAILMNQKALELHLFSTNFVTPHGLDDNKHYTTALDLAILTDYALQNNKFCEIVRTKARTIMINNYPMTLSNTNELLGNFEGIYGVKTGFTNGANRCLVTACKRGDLDIICVVLGCDTKKDRTRDSINLLNYVFNNFSVINVKDIIIKNFEEWKELHKNSFVIYKGVSNNLELYLDSQGFLFTHIAVNKSSLNNISANIKFEESFEAPLFSNTKIGEIQLCIDSAKYYGVDILNNNSIERKNILNYLVYIFKNYSLFFSE